MDIFYTSFDPGIPYYGAKGASIHVREFTKALRQAGHAVEVAISRLGSSQEAAFGVYELAQPEADFFRNGGDRAGDKLLAESRAFARNFHARLLPERGCDLVYERYSLFGVAGLDFARRAGAPFVLEVNSPLVEEEKAHRGLVNEELARAVAKYLFSQADCVVAVSDVVASYARSVSPEANVFVLPNGVDAEVFSHAEPNREMRRQLGDGRLIVGFVGSLKPWHGLETLLDAFASLPRNEFGLIIVGDGPLRERLEREAARLGLQDNAVFTGAVEYERVPEFLKALDVAAAPYPDLSDFYFSPIKIFEYMAAGCAIVASAIGQITELLRHEDNALLARPGDSNALADALRRLRSDATLRRRLGDAAQREAVQSHTWLSRVRALEPLLNSLVEKSKRRLAPVGASGKIAE